MYCYYQNMYQCPFMSSRTFNPQEFGCHYYNQFYNRQEGAGLELVEEVPPPGVLADVDPDFARKAARRCRRLGSVARLGVELENGERLTLRNFQTGRNSLTGIDVTTGLDEIIDYKSIARIRCMRARTRNGIPYEYDYEYCDCEEE